jgi:hypothetical protein
MCWTAAGCCKAATPLQIIQQPACAQVADSIGGADAGLRLLGLRTVRELLREGEAAGAKTVSADASLREALSLLARTASTGWPWPTHKACLWACCTPPICCGPHA